MKLSFDDEESFKEAVESLHLNNPSSNPNADQQQLEIRSSTSMPLEDSERNEDNTTPSDPITVRRVPVESSSSSIREIRRSGDSSLF